MASESPLVHLAIAPINLGKAVAGLPRFAAILYGASKNQLSKEFVLKLGLMQEWVSIAESRWNSNFSR